MLTSEQFERICRLSLSLAGIELSERHRELLSSRCRRMKINSGEGLESLLAAAEGGDGAARQRLIELLTTSFTGFFRNRWHFDIAAEHALWALHRRGKASLWSAAAATGEEPYSLAMAIIGVTRRDDPAVKILATDINRQVLERAREGKYGESELASLAPEQRSRFFEEQAGGLWRIAGNVQRLVDFQELNLNSDVWPVEGPFEVILCRNVLMYLNASSRLFVLRRMASLLSPQGILILDPAEHLGEGERLFGPGNRGIYSLPRDRRSSTRHNRSQ